MLQIGRYRVLLRGSFNPIRISDYQELWSPGAAAGFLKRVGSEGRHALDRAGLQRHLAHIEIAAAVRPDAVRRS